MCRVGLLGPVDGSGECRAPVSGEEQAPECLALQVVVSLMIYFLLSDQLVMSSL